MLVGAPETLLRLRAALGSRRSGIEYEFLAEVGRAELPDALEQHGVDEVIVADFDFDEEQLLEIVDAAQRHGARVCVAPKTTELLTSHGEYVPGQAVPLFALRPPVFAGTDWVVKRSFDLVVSAAVVVVGLPVWLAIAAAIKLSSPGPIFFPDRRIGLNEREFTMLKFRTMRAGAERLQGELEAHNEADGALFKIRDDPRVTGVGRVLRRLSLDELPQVLNVLRGEMSLVGPRPLRLRDYAQLEDWHRKRNLVLPGMTRPLADLRPVAPDVRRPRPPRLLLPRELVALAGRDDPDQDDPGGAQSARGLLSRRFSALPARAAQRGTTRPSAPVLRAAACVPRTRTGHAPATRRARAAAGRSAVTCPTRSRRRTRSGRR